VEERERLRDYDDRDEIDERLAKIVSRVVRDADIGISYKEGGESRLNAIVLSCAGVLCMVILGIGAWGITALIGTREEVAGMRTEMRSVVDRLDRLERKP